MKGTRLLYSIATLAGVGILACFIGYATDTLRMHTPKQQGQVETNTAVETKKKSCDCCKKSMARLRKQIQQAGERRQALQQTETTASSRKPTP